MVLIKKILKVLNLNHFGCSCLRLRAERVNEEGQRLDIGDTGGGDILRGALFKELAQDVGDARMVEIPMPHLRDDHVEVVGIIGGGLRGILRRGYGVGLAGDEQGRNVGGGWRGRLRALGVRPGRARSLLERVF